MSAGQVTVSSSTFLSGFGVNTRGGNYIDGYQNSSLIIQSMNYLGIKNVRDTLARDAKGEPIIDAMANAGLKFDIVVPSTLPSTGASGLAEFVKQLKEFQAEHPGSIVTVEGLNEVNISGFTYIGTSELSASAAYQKALYTAVKAEASLNGIGVINLSLGMDQPTDTKALGDLSKYADYANAHTYPHTGAMSADAVMQFSMDLARSNAKGDPLIITETGYTTLESSDGISVSTAAQAKLTLNNLLLAYENGAVKTYLYNLFDMSSLVAVNEREAYFGLFYEDGTPKPAAEAIHNFTTILSYGDTGAAGGGTFGFQLSNAPAKTHTMVMEKSGGVFDLVVWNEALVWDDAKDRDIVTKAVDVKVTLDKVEALVYVYDPLLGTAPIAIYKNVQSFTIPLSDHALIVEIGAKGLVQDKAPVSAASLTLTADQFVAQVDNLAISTGLQSVTLTDSHVLEVSSLNTMNHMIKNFGGVLSKIAGGFTFSVTYGNKDWSLTQTFDSDGHMLSRTDYTLVNGKVSTSVEVDADGSKQYYYYDSASRLTRDIAVSTDGTTTTLNYDVSSGKLLTKTVTGPSGAYLTEIYKNGVLTQSYDKIGGGAQVNTTYGITGKTYVTEITRLDTSGKVAEVVRNHADGTLDYRMTSNAKGTETFTYDAKGKLVSDVIAASDGTATTLLYDTASGKIFKSTVVKSGDTTITSYMNGVKTSVYTVLKNGQKTAQSFDQTTGKIVNETIQGPDGSYVTKIYKSGTLTQVYDKSGDGSQANTTYGGAYVTEITRIDASGKVVEIERKHVDDTLKTMVYNPTSGKLATSTVVKNGQTTTQSFDQATGNMVSEAIQGPEGSYVTKIYKNGILTQSYDKSGDGSQVNTTYGITGKTYITEITRLDTNGKVVEVMRKHADGTLDYRMTKDAKGTETFTYDAKGKLVSDIITAPDGTTTTLLNNTTNGELTPVITYTNGIKTSVETVLPSGDKTSQTFDATSGKITGEMIRETNGDVITKTFKNGVLDKVYEKHADGSQVNSGYNITGQTYTADRQTLDAKGQIVTIERFHSDGSYDFLEQRNTDGSKDISFFDASGKITYHITVEADRSQVVDAYLYATGEIKTDHYSATGLLYSDVHKNDAHSVTLYADNQVFHGGAGNDTINFRNTVKGDFIYDGGNDTLTSFNLARGAQDQIELDKEWASSFNDLHMSQSGSNVVIAFDAGHSITLQGAAVGSITADYFLFT